MDQILGLLNLVIDFLSNQFVDITANVLMIITGVFYAAKTIAKMTKTTMPASKAGPKRSIIGLANNMNTKTSGSVNENIHFVVVLNNVSSFLFWPWWNKSAMMGENILLKDAKNKVA